MKRYYRKAFVRAFLLSPLIASIGAILTLFLPALGLISLALTIGLWFAFVKHNPLPDTAWRKYLPIFLSFAYYMLVWLICYGLAHYSFGNAYMQVITILSFPFFAVFFNMSFWGDFTLYPYLLMVLYALVFLTVMIASRAHKRKLVSYRGGVLLLAASLCLCTISVCQHVSKNANYLGRDNNALRVEDEINYNDYLPFSEHSSLITFRETPTLTFDADYPRLDGATAAWPVYAAMTEFLYRGLDVTSAQQYVSCTTTTEAYERLIRGEVDIFFGAQPSAQQVALAQEHGLEFVLTPIAKEAFVFFVNQDNPVENLTVQQLQDIYQKKLTNWLAVGGHDERIIPFQRPENSGSQTIMQAYVMQGKHLPWPVMEEYAAGMGGVISEVATYRNYSSAIGYSFRYFATGMKPNPQIKLLAVEGQAPVIENIRSGSYPFTVDVYAVTTGRESENTQKLLSWILSGQGQRLIEACGYVGL